MKLTLTTDDGLLIGQWDIEQEFGDLEKHMSRQTLLVEVLAEYRRQKAVEAKEGRS